MLTFTKQMKSMSTFWLSLLIYIFYQVKALGGNKSNFADFNYQVDDNDKPLCRYFLLIITIKREFDMKNRKGKRTYTANTNTLFPIT